MSDHLPIVIASDHAGFPLKEHLSQYLRDNGYSILDLGPSEAVRCDYPDYAQRLCQQIQNQKATMGILICGTGIGMSMCANKCTGIRAALISDIFSAQATRAHNDSNVLCLGARVLGTSIAEKIVEVWLGTPFEGGRHQARLEKMMALDSDIL
jgi:ribose 5-phosphate isomerase B